ncbi:MAG: hypothetical protein GXP46_04835 [Deferribacteres bacterium]|nr:hypothetical protein [Deferribacteres bacterium]
MNYDIRKYDPAVDKRFLILIALSGIVWSLVGVILNALAVKWLSHTAVQRAAWLGSAGIILALLIHHFGFLRLVDKNIARIMAKKGKVCIFGFQPWKSYLIIIIMVALGITLRHSSLPKPYLAIIYIGFGGAMLLSSLRYHRIFFTLQKGD